MELTPIRRATVFPGLCEAHDASLFEPIDRYSLREPTAEQSLSLSFSSCIAEFVYRAANGAAAPSAFGGDA
jgi:hypothetical protein